MSEFPVEDLTIEGRLADIIEPDDCVVQVDKYKLSQADKQKVVRALRLASIVAKIAKDEPT